MTMLLDFLESVVKFWAGIDLVRENTSDIDK